MAQLVRQSLMASDCLLLVSASELSGPDAAESGPYDLAENWATRIRACLGGGGRVIASGGLFIWADVIT